MQTAATGGWCSTARARPGADKPPCSHRPVVPASPAKTMPVRFGAQPLLRETCPSRPKEDTQDRPPSLHSSQLTAPMGWARKRRVGRDRTRLSVREKPRPGGVSLWSRPPASAATSRLAPPASDVASMQATASTASRPVAGAARRLPLQPRRAALPRSNARARRPWNDDGETVGLPVVRQPGGDPELARSRLIIPMSRRRFLRRLAGVDTYPFANG